MPRTLRSQLRRMLERANPNVATFVELSAPDTAKILRRAEDQFLASPDPLVSMTPAVSAAASPAGGLTLASTAVTLISQMANSGTYFFLPQEQGSDRFHGTVGWKLDSAFPGGVLRGVTVKLRWVSPASPDVALQIYKVHRTAGVLQLQQGTSTIETAAVQHSFAPLLQQPVVRRFRDVAVLFSDVDVSFDLTPFRLAIDPISSPPPGPNESGDLAEYFFEIRPLQQGQGNFVGWVKDTTSSRDLANIGLVREVGWQRGNPDDPASLWTRSDKSSSLTIKIDIEEYAPTSQEVYSILLPQAPVAESTGRVVFRAGEPSGTAATIELSTAGSSGPWTAVEDGDEVTVRQAQYHARLTMNASSDLRRAPVVTAVGVEYRTTTDLTPESIVEAMSQGVSIPFCQASIGEGSIKVVRTGRRDYRDLGGVAATQGADTQLELDTYLGSRHPLVSRADWFHLSRAMVSTRTPSGTAEAFTLLSIAKTLQRKIPARIESISTAHSVVGTPSPTTTQLRVSPQLIGASPTGNEYDGQGYYLRVRKSSQPGVETGAVFLIGGNTGIDKLDFPSNADPSLTKELPGTLAIGDEVEVHSGRYQQPAISWVDADPADVWYDILTTHLGVPDGRIGLADVGGNGRAGRPPKVTDIAPGDAATQAKRCVTLKLTEAEKGDALIDQLSFLMGGVTIEIAGQLVFRQIYALKDGAGNVTVAPDPVVATFDARDYTALETPTGREQRITVLACDYGVDTTAAEALPTATTNYVDVDALAAYELQDVDGLGTAVVPSEIARWCYNSTDFGLFLASQVAQQVVGACSTGVRLWSWTTVDAHPELTVGDTVAVVTDQYTDYDPAQDAPVAGMNAYPLVLVGTAGGGRRFTGFLQGLAGVVGVDVRGGEGTLQDNNVAIGGAPSLEMEIRHDPTVATIDYAAANGSIALYIDGAGPSAVPASPITGIARPAAGSEPIEYAIQITGTNGQILRQSVTVLPIDADTRVPNFVVTPGTPTDTTMPFTGVATDPAGLVTPGMTVELKGCTASATGLVPDVVYPWDGSIVTVDRPAFDPTTHASIIMTAAIPGGGRVEIQRTILNQVKTSFGPSLNVTVTPGSSTYTIAYTATGTVELSIDGGGYSAAPASPISVTRDGTDHTYDFRATLDGQVTPGHADVPALPASSTPATGVFTSVSSALQSAAADTVRFSWVWSGTSTVTFQIYARENSDPFDYIADAAAGVSHYDYTSAFDLDGGAQISPSTIIDFFVRAIAPNGSVVTQSDTYSKRYGTT